MMTSGSSWHLSLGIQGCQSCCVAEVPQTDANSVPHQERCHSLLFWSTKVGVKAPKRSIFASSMSELQSGLGKSPHGCVLYALLSSMEIPALA